MKAMHKQLWGYLLITLSLAGFTPLQAQTDSADEGGYITVSGIVKDKKSKKSLEKEPGICQYFYSGQYDRHGHERRR